MDIKKTREAMGLTPQVMADKLGVHWTTVYRWESGERKASKMAQNAIRNLAKRQRTPVFE